MTEEEAVLRGREAVRREEPPRRAEESCEASGRKVWSSVAHGIKPRCLTGGTGT